MSLSKKKENEIKELDVFYHGINLLEIEGLGYFCFDPKEASRKSNISSDEYFQIINNPEGEIEERRIEYETNPNYGHPSVLAYKIYQAILKKASDYGIPATDKVSFSSREMARCIGRKAHGGSQQAQIYKALKQLLMTHMTYWIYDKETKKWASISFSFLITTLMSGTKGRLSSATVQLHPLVVSNINNFYSFGLNYTRIEELEPISTALYKHLWYQMSNLYRNQKREKFIYRKNYKTICNQWLGGMSVQKYQSKILERLGPHLDAVKKSGLIKKYSVDKNASGTGFNISIWPGSGFFEDYNNIYRKNSHNKHKFIVAKEKGEIQEPLEILSYFYKKLYGGAEDKVTSIFLDKEKEFAYLLRKEYSFEEICELIDFTLAEAPKTKFEIKNFGAVKGYVSAWLAQKSKKIELLKEAHKRKIDRNIEAIKNKYDGWRKNELAKLRTGISNSEITRLEKQFREKICASDSRPIGLELRVKIKVDEVLTKRFEIPSFDQWLNSNKDTK